ncbi:hypothetical protein Oweho_0026 [Owenweeksia hongkongensis DSM 17368]|uniref:Secretion system C-terminal sorting domain-containing protein n=1 Tax=Owenweeksia hongkongensis (strain DSM 17368 / CIP 108786 / JCM 12287 / NRRL B-23963 / UST20020801) TaxID=926562 RepID=G8R539_OWEHD|nr:T9SS type A sorting domain-containing protein [Owenweeksia hongkongensis]AEV31050.1 hypothetical protein Oweho_0026 [Owenweeksia hongkongensis DSM 17368]
MNKQILVNFKKTMLFGALAIFSSALSAQSFVGSKVLRASNNLSVDISTYSVGDSVNIIITGPATAWHAVGFGGNSMNGTYCIVVDGNGNVTERKLGNHNGGTQLMSSVSFSNTNVASGTRTTLIKRPLTGTTANHFTFPGNGNAVSVIWAYGSGPNFGSHSNRGASLVTFNPNCLNAVDVTTSRTGNELSSNQTGATYRWLDCGNSFAPISGETSQSFTATSNGSYAVEVTSGSCVDTSACIIVSTVGLDENSLAEMTVIYPNPATDKITVEFPVVMEGGNMFLKDLSGRMLRSKSFDASKSIEFDLNESTGIYILEIQSNTGESISKKILVQ